MTSGFPWKTWNKGFGFFAAFLRNSKEAPAEFVRKLKFSNKSIIQIRRKRGFAGLEPRGFSLKPTGLVYRTEV
jgi:hypothetical protein